MSVLLGSGWNVAGAQTKLPAVLKSLGTLSEPAILNIVSEGCLAADLTPDERRSLKARTASDQFIERLAGLRCRVRAVSILPISVRLSPAARASVDVVTWDSGGSSVAPTGITWRVSDTAVANVTNAGTHGVLVGMRPGETDLIVEAEGRLASIRVTVAVPTAQRVAITRKVKFVAEGTGAQLTAAVSDENGVELPDSAVEWGSRSPGILTVDSRGFVFGVAAGIANIYASIRGIPRDSVNIQVLPVQQGTAAAMPLQAPSAAVVAPPPASSSGGTSTATPNAAMSLAHAFESARDSLIALANKKGTASNVDGDGIGEARASWTKAKTTVAFQQLPGNGRDGEGVWQVIAEIQSNSFVRPTKTFYRLTVRVPAGGMASSTLTREQQ